MAENIIIATGDTVQGVNMPKGTVIVTTENMIQILHTDVNGMIREWRFELDVEGLQLYATPGMDVEKRIDGNG